MVSRITLMLTLSLLAAPLMAVWSSAGSVRVPALRILVQAKSTKIETDYDAQKDRTTIRLTPVQISAAQGKYISVHMSPAFSFTGRRVATPAILDFELQTVVKGRLSTDLYVVFIIDGETVFLSSSRWGIKRPVRGRVWMGERLVFRMPYETFEKITKAQTFETKLDAETFVVGETQRQALREFLNYMKPAETGPASSPR